MEKIQLSRVFRLTNGKSISSDYSDIKKGEYIVPIYGGNSVLGYAKKHLIDAKTLVLGRVGEYCGNVNLVDGRIWVSDNALYISEWLTECDIKYLFYVLTQVDINRFSDATGQPKITQSLLKRIHAFFPSEIAEQTAIATILSKIDEAIEATQNSIKAAEKLKKALMQNLLTGKLKPDGTWRTDDEFYVDEKFGKVPKGWEVKRVKDVFEINQKSLPSQTDGNYKFRYITIEAVNTENIDFENCPDYLFKESPGRARRIMIDGDILISGVRPNLKAFVIYERPNDENWICSTGFYVLTAKEDESNKFYFYQILSEIGEKQFHSYVAGSNYPAIGDRDIKNMKLLSPQYNEQLQIADKIGKVSQSNEQKQTKISTLQRLKKSLMQNLLTGKVRLQAEFIAQFENTLEENK
jgi:type I restriction enzyme S subunit